MKVTLVQPPSNRFDTSELAPPLGLLSIAAMLREDSVDVEIVDLNYETLAEPRHLGPGFYAWASERIAATAPDLVGFTSMALESHVGLELGRRLKAADPAVRIALGGPHFSAVAEPMLSLYPWVDYVVLGEGEYATRALVRALRRGQTPSDIANLAWRAGGRTRVERRFKPARSLDDIPFPAYELVDLAGYFRLNPYRVLDVEHARGCALRCAFCYSPGHWGQGEQARSIDRILEDVQRHYDLGARHLFFVGDNFLNSKSFAVSVADAIAGAGLDLTWRCYATQAQLTEEVVEALARSSCRCLFIGVDAVSERTKRNYRKSYFRGWPELRRTLQRCLDRGMEPTCAFLVNPPTDATAIADTEAALATATRVYNLQCGVRLNPLTVYPKTGLAPITAQFPVAYCNEKPRLLLDGHWVTETNPYAQVNPALFPYHCTVGRPADYAGFVRATHVGFTLLDHFPRTLMQAAHAGLSLWSLLSDTAAQVDYADERKGDWRDQEADAFARLVAGRQPTASLRDTLSFELAENRLRRGAPGVEVKLRVEDARLAVRLRPHAAIQLSRPPSDYETTEAVAAAPDAAAQDYVLVPNGPAIRYLQPDRRMGSVLRALQQAAIDGEPVELPGDEVVELVAARLIDLPDYAGTGIPTGVSP